MGHSHSLIDQLERGFFSVLVVDDDPDIVSGMKDILENSGYAAETASCASEARKLLRQRTFSLLVCDYSLPDDNGIHLSREAKKLQPDLGLILMTGHDPQVIRKKLNSIDIELMRKPVEVSALLDVLERTLQHQCETLKITRKKPTAVAVEEMPPRSPEPIHIQFASFKPNTTFNGDVALPDYPAAKRKRKVSLAWAATAILGFGIGWLSRPATPTAAENPVESPIFLPDLLHPMRPSGTDALIGPVQPAAVLLAGKVEAKKEPQEHKPRLSDSDPAVRISAAKALLKSNPHNARALKTLLAILVDPLSKKHLAAIEALSTTGASSPEVVTSLAHALGDDDQSVAGAAATTLGRFGKVAVPAADELVDAMSYKGGSYPAVTRAAKETLIGLGEGAIPALNRALDDPRLKPQILEVLARIEPPTRVAVTSVLPPYKGPTIEPGTGLEGLPESDDQQAAAAPTTNNASATR